MAKLIVVTLDMLEEAEQEFGDLFADDPFWQQFIEELDRWVAEDNARREAAYAEEQATNPDEERE